MPTMLLCCVWLCSALALVASEQTYYINFVFNNYRDRPQTSAGGRPPRSEKQVLCDVETSSSTGDNGAADCIDGSDWSDGKTRRPGDGSNGKTRRPGDGSNGKTRRPGEGSHSSGDSQAESPEASPTRHPSMPPTTVKRTSTATPTTGPTPPPTPPTPPPPTSIPTPAATPMPPPDRSECINYPEAVCWEDSNLHELFGVTLVLNRGLPIKLMCTFQNSWSGPWMLMYRLELPVRVHMRHWMFGYVTDDCKDLNINFLALAHIINVMRIAMLIIGQDNKNQLVYNLYDNVVISSFNDLFLLRKAHIVEANTTDLLFISVGQALLRDNGSNRTCPFQVVGSWWGGYLGAISKYYCVFPVERNIYRPGYVAIFIKPSPFAINNTAFYATQITTRRPWETTEDPVLLEEVQGDISKYKEIKDERTAIKRKKVAREIRRRMGIDSGSPGGR